MITDAVITTICVNTASVIVTVVNADYALIDLCKKSVRMLVKLVEDCKINDNSQKELNLNHYKKLTEEKD